VGVEVGVEVEVGGGEVAVRCGGLRRRRRLWGGGGRRGQWALACMRRLRPSYE
jgi:hypothetical protein